VHRSALEAEAKQAGCTIERDGALFVVRDDWTENEDHAEWLVATKVGVPLESVTVGLGAERSGANGVTPAHDGDDFTRSSLHRNSRPGGRCPKRRGALRIMRLAGARAWSAAASGARPSRASPNAGQDTRILQEVELRPGAAYQPCHTRASKAERQPESQSRWMLQRGAAFSAVSYAGLGSVSSAGSLRLETSTRSTSSELVGWLAGELTLPGASRRPRLQ
jgi:hypothetical protein